MLLAGRARAEPIRLPADEPRRDDDVIARGGGRVRRRCSAHDEVYAYDANCRRTGVYAKRRAELVSFARIWFRNPRARGFLGEAASREVIAEAAVYVSNETDGTVVVIDPRRGAVVAAEGHAVPSEIPVDKGPKWVALTPDDRIAVVSNTASSDVTRIDAQARRVLATLPVGSSPMRLAVGVLRGSAPAGGGTL